MKRIIIYGIIFISWNNVIGMKTKINPMPEEKKAVNLALKRIFHQSEHAHTQHPHTNTITLKNSTDEIIIGLHQDDTLFKRNESIVTFKQGVNKNTILLLIDRKKGKEIFGLLYSQAITFLSAREIVYHQPSKSTFGWLSNIITTLYEEEPVHTLCLLAIPPAIMGFSNKSLKKTLAWSLGTYLAARLYTTEKKRTKAFLADRAAIDPHDYGSSIEILSKLWEMKKMNQSPLSEFGAWCYTQSIGRLAENPSLETRINEIKKYYLKSPYKD